jgi:hypothetical protein
MVCRDRRLDRQKTWPSNGAALITSHGVLKLLPFRDPLRGDPRFDQIVSSLAPVEAVK